MLRKIRSGPQRNVTKTLCDIFNDHLLYLKSMCDENRLVRIFGDKYKHNSLINEELGRKIILVAKIILLATVGSLRDYLYI